MITSFHVGNLGLNIFPWQLMTCSIKGLISVLLQYPLRLIRFSYNDFFWLSENPFSVIVLTWKFLPYHLWKSDIKKKLSKCNHILIQIHFVQSSLIKTLSQCGGKKKKTRFMNLFKWPDSKNRSARWRNFLCSL